MIRAFLTLALICLFSGSASAEPNGDGTYTVRGTIKQMPSQRNPRELLIRHEPIANYVDETGSSKEMPAMTMPFNVDESVALQGLKEGDAIEFTWVSRWQPKIEDRVTAIKKIG